MSVSDSDYQYDPPYGHEQAGEGQFEESYREALDPFWAQQKREIAAASTDLAEYKTQQLPLARIKKIMKSDEDVRMISAEAPVLFAKACELFILDLTIRGWVHAEDSRRRTLQRSDIAACIAHWEVLDFLSDVIPLEEGKEGEGNEGGQGAAAAAAAAGGGGAAAAGGGVADMGGAAAGAVPQMYHYGAPPPMGMYQQHPQQQQQQQAVPDMQVPSPVMPPALAEPPIAAAMFQQWSSEGQQAMRRGGGA